MADINKLKDKIKSTIYPNGKGAINASDHQAMLLDMADGMAETDTKLATLSSDINDIREHGEIHAYVAGTNDAPTWNIASDRLSRYIKVYKGDRVTIKAATSYGVYCKIVTSVDTSKTPILLQGFFRGQSAEFSVEADGYLMWLLQYDPSQSFAPSELTINGIDCVGGAYKVSKIDGLSKEIAKIDNNVLLLKEEFGESKKIDSVVKGDAGLMLSFKDFSEDGYWTYSNGAVINNGYNYRSYPLLPLTSGQKIKFKGLKSTGSYLAAQIMYLYDNEYRPFNGNYGKILPSQLGLDENGDCEYTLPNNVGYVGFSWTSDYPSEFTIEIEGSWEFTDEAISKIQAACSANSVSEISLGSYYLKGNMEKKAITKKLCIIAGGQSNMNGAIPISEKPSFITLPMNNCHYCYRNNSVTSGGFVPLTEAQLSNWGVDLSLYNQLCNVDGREIYVIKQSLGGVGIDPEGNTGDLCWTADYELIPEAKSFIRGLEKQIRELRENEGENFEIAAFIWHQGEGDYKSPADARYYDNLRKVIAYVRGIVGNPVLPFVFGTISHKSAQYSSVVEAAMNKIAAEDVNTQLIDMSEASLRDAYHFNADWAAYLGKKMYDALIDLKAISGTKLNPTKP